MKLKNLFIGSKFAAMPCGVTLASISDVGWDRATKAEMFEVTSSLGSGANVTYWALTKKGFLIESKPDGEEANWESARGDSWELVSDVLNRLTIEMIELETLADKISSRRDCYIVRQIFNSYSMTLCKILLTSMKEKH